MDSDQKNQQNQSYQNKFITKVGKRISKEDLIKYLEVNKEILKNINIVESVVDLNETSNKTEKEEYQLENATFQMTFEVKYLPPNIEKIMDLKKYKYLHTGCLKTIVLKNKRQHNVLQISLLSSIMTCLYPQFSQMIDTDQSSLIERLFEKIKSDIFSDSFKKNDYTKKYKWTKEEIEAELINCSYNGKSLKYISDFFHINIFILNLEKDKILFPVNEIVMFKKTIFLLKFPDNTYEPIFLGSNRQLSKDCEMMNNIKNNFNNIEIMEPNSANLTTLREIEEDLTKYKPKIVKKKIKREKPEIIAEREKEKNKYDDSMNAYSDDELSDKQNIDINAINPTNLTKPTKTKSLSPKNNHSNESDDSNNSDNSDESDNSVISKKEEKEEKLKKISKNNKASNVNSTDIKLTDIKSTLKIDELKSIANKLGIKTDKKTKALLMTEIKNKLK